MTDDESGGTIQEERLLPDDPVAFIQDCVRRKRILWTYHLNMRSARRFIRRETILAAVDTFELVEAYPTDKYLPSYLLLARNDADVLHVLFAVDIAGDSVRAVTAYRPDPDEWEADLRSRRRKI